MRLSQIVTVVIRILAVFFFISAAEFLFGLLRKLYYRPILGADYAALALIVGFGIVLWWWSPFFARLFTSGQDASLDAPHLVLSDVYRFAFLLVGLYFAVGALGPTITWLHYAATKGSSQAGLTPEQRATFYRAFDYATQLLVGIALILNSRKLAAKLIKHQDGIGEQITAANREPR